MVKINLLSAITTKWCRLAFVQDLRHYPVMRRLNYLALMCLLACGPDETISGYADPQAVFVLQAINDGPFAARATIRFPEAGRISGDGPCNGYSATQSAPYPWFDAGPIVATRRACPDLQAETTFFETLTAMRIAEVSGPVLLLSNDAGETMLFQSD